MICKKCKNIIPDGFNICPACGAKVKKSKAWIIILSVVVAIALIVGGLFLFTDVFDSLFDSLGEKKESERTGPLFKDSAGLLTESESDYLKDLLDDLSDDKNIDIIVLTVDNFGSKTGRNYAKKYYEKNNYGGKNGGCLLVYCKDSRSWTVYSCGKVAERRIDENEIDEINSMVAEYFKTDDYLEGFKTFADYVAGRVKD